MDLNPLDLNQRSSGVLLHITSLPGPHGIGDFGPAAYHFVDWLQSAGQRLWQLLPMTPVGPGNSPYQSASAFAGSPLMVALEPLVERGWLAPVEPPAFDAMQVDFERVAPWRMQQLRAAAAVSRPAPARPKSSRWPTGVRANRPGSPTTRCSWRWRRRTAASPGGPGTRRWPGARARH